MMNQRRNKQQNTSQCVLQYLRNIKTHCEKNKTHNTPLREAKGKYNYIVNIRILYAEMHTDVTMHSSRGK